MLQTMDISGEELYIGWNSDFNLWSFLTLFYLFLVHTAKCKRMFQFLNRIGCHFDPVPVPIQMNPKW